MKPALDLCTAAILASVSIGVLPSFASDGLEERFQSPPDSARPHTGWHWMNGYVSAEGITKNLEAMKRVGIGGFQAFQIEYRMDPGPVKYLSKEWRELMKLTVRDGRIVAAVPDWLKRGTPRPATPRKTFSTSRFYTKDSPLLDSGLIGPVQLRFGVKKTLADH